ncbi:hypothetical protein [Actinoallomurus iriomotensis]|uniref:hypothetical protein n=1 Tax=Actinoallomurus iriomotensis TaxID=478107 RepID=UPI0025531B7D|nr:hypothetical protein [Actinoallomurus iriomotensis]
MSSQRPGHRARARAVRLAAGRPTCVEAPYGDGTARARRRSSLALNGKGDDLNRALQSTAGLTQDLAAQDQRIVRLARNLRAFAAGPNRRDRDLGGTIDDIAGAGRLLTGERTRLKGFLSGMVTVIRKSGVLITAYRETLPSLTADLPNVVMSLKVNSGSPRQAIGPRAPACENGCRRASTAGWNCSTATPRHGSPRWR